MTESLKKAVEEFLVKSDRVEFDRVQFFRDWGFRAKLMNPEREERSFLIVYDGTEGTLVPPIRIPVGVNAAAQELPRYFEDRNRCFVDPIKGWEVVELPELMLTDIGWSVRQKGVIDGNASPKH